MYTESIQRICDIKTLKKELVIDSILVSIVLPITALLRHVFYTLKYSYCRLQNYCNMKTSVMKV